MNVWQDHAACAGNGDLFYPVDDETPRQKYQRTALAKTYCADCPVRQDCHQWAIDNDERHGIWGGLTAEERRRQKYHLAAVRRRAA